MSIIFHKINYYNYYNIIVEINFAEFLIISQ